MSDLLLHQHCSPETVSVILAAFLESSDRPLTRVLEDLSGSVMSIVVTASGERPLTASEAARLDVAAETRCCWREGLLRSDAGLVAARTTLVWLPERLPPDVSRELEAGKQPAGKILARLGMRRVDRRALAVQGDGAEARRGAAAISSAVLMSDDCVKMGIAGEEIERKFACTLARAADEGLAEGVPSRPAAEDAEDGGAVDASFLESLASGRNAEAPAGRTAGA
jgi:chorismate-pyruvate lyase